MNRKEANKLVKQKYGPTAGVVNVSAKNRNERFGVMYVQPAGALADPVLCCLGYGASYQEAVNQAEQNPLAIEYAKQFEAMKADFAEFGKDPNGYLQRRKEEMEKIYGQ